MKILKSNAGALSNYEALDFLRSKGASKHSSRFLSNIPPSEFKVYDYLVESVAAQQNREIISEFVEKCKQFKLAKAEVLNIINTRPSDTVYLYPLIDQCDQGFGDTIEDLNQMVIEALPSPSMSLMPEAEIKEDGDKANNQQTDQVNHAQGTQMETS